MGLQIFAIFCQSLQIFDKWTMQMNGLDDRHSQNKVNLLDSTQSYDVITTKSEIKCTQGSFWPPENAFIRNISNKFLWS